jgi:hypothetical protein
VETSSTARGRCNWRKPTWTQTMAAATGLLLPDEGLAHFASGLTS